MDQFSVRLCFLYRLNQNINNTQNKEQSSINDGSGDSGKHDFAESTGTQQGGGGGLSGSSVGEGGELLVAVFRWEHGGNQVFISGTFNGWKTNIPMIHGKYRTPYKA